MSYTLLGVAAGSIGAAIDLGGRMAGVQRSAAMIAGAAMVVFGVIILFNAMGVRVQRVTLPKRHQRLVERGHRAAMMLGPEKRAATIGLLTPLLPCGWLYAFVLTSAGTGSPAWGGLVMAVFWFGTVPLMATLGAGLTMLTGPLRARLPLITASIVVIIGVLTATGRVGLPTFTTRAMLGAQPAIAEAGFEATSAAEQVRRLRPHEMPCCNAEPDARMTDGTGRESEPRP